MLTLYSVDGVSGLIDTSLMRKSGGIIPIGENRSGLVPSVSEDVFPPIVTSYKTHGQDVALKNSSSLASFQLFRLHDNKGSKRYTGN